MALAIATNNAALNAAASASSVNRDMETSMARLSSGKRINSASDDAAGVAISSRLSAEIRGTDQAIRNSLDGQALIDTAEGAHREIENILQRMREIAVQAANDTNNDQDRGNLQAEMDAMSAEIDRIAGTTTWAGANLMEDTTTPFSFQVGAATGTQNQITIDIKSMNTIGLGLDGGTDGVEAADAVPAAPAVESADAYTLTADELSNNGDITDGVFASANVTIDLDDGNGNTLASVTITAAADDSVNAGLITDAFSDFGVTAAGNLGSSGGSAHSDGDGIKLTFVQVDAVVAADATDAVDAVTALDPGSNISVEDTSTGSDDAGDNALASIILIDAAIKPQTDGIH
jgi:flagellin